MRISSLISVFSSDAHAANSVSATSKPIHFPGETVTITLAGTTVHYQPTGVGPTDLAQSIDVRFVGADFASVGNEQGATGGLDATSFLVGGT